VAPYLTVHDEPREELRASHKTHVEISFAEKLVLAEGLMVVDPNMNFRCVRPCRKVERLIPVENTLVRRFDIAHTLERTTPAVSFCRHAWSSALCRRREQ
jgi:hypothetical protein